MFAFLSRIHYKPLKYKLKVFFRYKDAWSSSISDYVYLVNFVFFPLFAARWLESNPIHICGPHFSCVNRIDPN